MWTPEIIFCIATQCWLAQAQPLASKDLCEAFITAVMVPTITQTVPNALIHTTRCTYPGIPA
jgi:hypothetical protein